MDPVDHGPHGLHIERHQFVGAFRYRDRALRVGSYGEAGDAAVGGLFLDATTIGDHERAGGDQFLEREIVHRLAHMQPSHGHEPVMQTEAFQVAQGARMHREDHGMVLGHLFDQVYQISEAILVVHRGWTMDRHKHLTTGSKLQPLQHIRRLNAVFEGHQRIDHGVAGEVDALRCDTFGEQVFRTAGLRHQKSLGDAVGKDPVDLFGHTAVTAAQATFQVDQVDAAFVGGERCGQGAIHITHDHHGVGLLLLHDLFQAQHDVGHLGVGCAWLNAEPVIGYQTELLEENGAHAVVEVLTGMHELHLPVTPLCSHGLHARDLDEIGPRAYDHQQLPHPSDLYAKMRSLAGMRRHAHHCGVHSFSFSQLNDRARKSVAVKPIRR